SVVNASSGARLARSRKAFTARITPSPTISTGTSVSSTGEETVAGDSASTSVPTVNTRPLKTNSRRNSAWAGESRAPRRRSRRRPDSAERSPVADRLTPTVPPIALSPPAHRSYGQPHLVPHGPSIRSLHHRPRVARPHRAPVYTSHPAIDGGHPRRDPFTGSPPVCPPPPQGPRFYPAFTRRTTAEMGDRPNFPKGV